jgi:predicted ArsR family transcriptional regulator
MPWAIDRVHTMSGVASLVGQTKLELLRLMMEEGGTAERLAARLQMNVSAVRRHLEALTKARLVEASFERRGRGRPSKIYKITLEGREVFGTGYDMLLIYLTGALLAKLGQGEAVKLMAETARSLAAGLRRGPGASSYLPLLEQLGFRPMIRKRRGQLSLISRNCPVLRAAKEYPDLFCQAFHGTLLSEVMGAPTVTLKETMARGSRRCIHQVNVGELRPPDSRPAPYSQ